MKEVVYKEVMKLWDAGIIYPISDSVAPLPHPFHAYAWEANKLTFQSHVYTTSNVAFTSPSLIHPRIGVEDPRICVEGTLAARNRTEPTLEPFKRDSKPR
ncbi:hypothetical protein PIB30_066358 [Stylosanthes scabra]|uniref:Uncharacterized protein n=1 Tax=Stylosanthes scabra TaxID=79078 RepID=A0ABU6WKK9_9FABA|nr:hypothetical protein [Stylosanthes scabra]